MIDLTLLSDRRPSLPPLPIISNVRVVTKTVDSDAQAVAMIGKPLHLHQSETAISSQPKVNYNSGILPTARAENENNYGTSVKSDSQKMAPATEMNNNPVSAR